MPREVQLFLPRWHNHLNPGINNKEWSKKEDEILFDSHRRYGSKWK
jgi:hypothetical protein